MLVDCFVGFLLLRGITVPSKVTLAILEED